MINDELEEKYTKLLKALERSLKLSDEILELCENIQEIDFILEENLACLQCKHLILKDIIRDLYNISFNKERHDYITNSRTVIGIKGYCLKKYLKNSDDAYVSLKDNIADIFKISKD